MQSSASDITPDNIAKTARIKKIQRISLLLLFLAGIINFLDRGSLSVR
ncbi:L-galactonate transporter [Providencia stuartii]|nr:L-galactonate transporter [Providencia stuartii]